MYLCNVFGFGPMGFVSLINFRGKKKKKKIGLCPYNNINKSSWQKKKGWRGEKRTWGGLTSERESKGPHEWKEAAHTAEFFRRWEM